MVSSEYFTVSYFTFDNFQVYDLVLFYIVFFMISESCNGRIMTFYWFAFVLIMFCKKIVYGAIGGVRTYQSLIFMFLQWILNDFFDLDWVIQRHFIYFILGLILFCEHLFWNLRRVFEESSKVFEHIEFL